jgi:DNA-packaging protein gp3
MAAPIGNKNAEGNEGGRPPIYDSENKKDIKAVVDLCEEYFEYIKGEYKEDEVEIEPEVFGIKKEWIRKPEPPTVTGLTLFLGFESKSTLYDYSKKIEFSNPIKRALTKIEQHHEIQASFGDKCTGNIFILKNFGWVDKQEVDQTIKVSQVEPVIFQVKK